MPEIDYQAIADEMRVGWLPPQPQMSPNEYWDSLLIHSAANAIERVGQRKAAANQPETNPEETR